MQIVGVDVGGTFTDLALYDGRRLRMLKVFTTPHDPSQGVLEGLAQLGVSKDAVIVHGSTIATNAFLERKGARIALFTTEGFRDLLAIARQTRGKLYDLFWKRARGLVRPEDIRVVRERIDAQGRVVTPLNPRDVRLPRGAQAAAVCFLHAYRNPRHERRAGTLLKKSGVPVMLSSDVLPEYREYERLSTTVTNAYLAPVVEGYARRLMQSLRGHPIRMMGSQGGSVTLQGACRKPISMILSGPAAGVVAADELSKRVRDPRLITLDMGGTSTDVSLLHGGPLLTRESKLDGIAIRTPMLDTVTVGAGGGSIAWLDEAGILRVGPHSQGSTPGPACYGRGGKLPTVTDAHLVLGRLDPDRFFGGRVKLDRSRAALALDPLARSLRRDVESVADAVIRVANSNMERALRVISLERGFDVRDFSLVAFGGAGPLHACELARDLGLRRVIVPPSPGNFCALGAILADILKERSRTVLVECSRSSSSLLAATARGLERALRRELAAERCPAQDAIVSVFAEMRYRGQSYELAVPWTLDADRLRRDFHEAHRKRYGYLMPSNSVDVVNLLVQVRVPMEKPKPIRRRRAAATVPSRARCRIDGRWMPVAHFERSGLPDRLRGPAVIHEAGSTTFVPPGCRVKVDSWGNLLVDWT